MAAGSELIRRNWQGRWALVTGASAGIGQALAVELAAAGVHLVITARRGDRLEELSFRLRAAYAIQVRVIVADLENPAAPQDLFAEIEGQRLAIDLLVNNAGFGHYGFFHESPIEKQLAMVQVNCTAVVHLTRLFLPAMIARGRGDVLIVASTASFQPVPYLATYAATKGFDRFFAEALAEENARFGIRVSALCPGSTESEFREVSGSRERSRHKYQAAEPVARRGLEALARGESASIPYTGGKLQTFLQRFVPRRAVSRLAERAFRPPMEAPAPRNGKPGRG